MAYLAHIVLVLSCWTATGTSVVPSNKATIPGKVAKDRRVSMVVNPHGPIMRSGRENSHQHSTVGKPTNTITRKEPSYIEKSAKSKSKVTVFGDSECREKEFELELQDSRDWTSSCYTVELETTDNTSKLATTAKRVEKEAETAPPNSSALIHATTATESIGSKTLSHPAKVQAKITCDGDGAIIIYNENDDGCMNHASRFLLDKDQATLARSGKCLTGDAEVHDKDVGSISIQFRNIDENTVFPECFKESSIPLPSALVAYVGPEKALWITVGACVGGLFILCLIFYWAWKKCAPEDESDKHQMMKGWGKGGSW